MKENDTQIHFKEKEYLIDLFTVCQQCVGYLRYLHILVSISIYI